MAEYPAMPLFTDAYMADTRHLTTAQHGAYLLMLMTAWRMPDCMLPNDDDFLSRICCMDKRTWNKNKEALLAFWEHPLIENIDNSNDSDKVDKQKWCQARLRDERKYVEYKRNKNVAAGKASALKRKERHSASVSTKGQPESNQPTPTPTKEDNAKALSKKSAKKKISLDELSVEHNSDWLVKKRSEGKYLNHDEHHVLEVFKNYCKAKGKTYVDYIAAYRNAFDWERCNPRQQRDGGNKSKRQRTIEAVERGLGVQPGQLADTRFT